MANVPVEFSINVTGEVTGELFKGVFKAVPYLSHAGNLRRDQARRDLLGAKPDEASVDAVNVSVAFSKIWAHVVETPSWWKDSRNGLDLLDEKPIAAIFDEVLRIEKEAQEAVAKAAAVAKADSK